MPLSSIRCNIIFKFQLPVITFVTNTLTSYLPVILTEIGVSVCLLMYLMSQVPYKYQTLITVIWMAARAITFFTMFLFKQWHGTLITPIVSAVAVTGGFTVRVNVFSD